MVLQGQDVINIESLKCIVIISMELETTKLYSKQNSRKIKTQFKRSREKVNIYNATWSLFSCQAAIFIQTFSPIYCYYVILQYAWREKNIYKLDETLSKASLLYFLTFCYTKNNKEIVLSYSFQNESIYDRENLGCLKEVYPVSFVSSPR